MKRIWKSIFWLSGIALLLLVMPGSASAAGNSNINATAEAVSSNRIDLKWNPISQADKYIIYRKNSANGSFQKVKEVSATVFQDSGIADYGTHQCFRNTVCNLHIAAIGKIALHGVHQNICAAAGSLVIRQCHSKLRIHDGKTGPG